MAIVLRSLGQLADVLALNTVRALAQAEAGLAQAAQLVQKDAKERIGEYQHAAGPYTAWQELAPSTQEERERLGYSPNDPLLRDGTLRASIVTEHSRLEAVVGSKLPIARYQELGTNRIPPRPFLGPAAFANMGKIKKLIGHRVAATLAGNALKLPASNQ